MFKERFLSGIILMVFAVSSFFIGGAYLANLLLVFSLIAYWELTKAMGCNINRKKINWLQVAGMGGTIIYYEVMYFGDVVESAKNVFMLLLTIIATFLILMLVYVTNFPKYTSNQMLSAFFSFMYAPIMLSFVYLTRETLYGEYVVWLILISSWGGDTFAYLVGSLIGKHHIFPNLSPKKSLEGCIGAVIGTGILGYVYGMFFIHKVIPAPQIGIMTAITAAAGSIMGMFGDLTASAIKRDNNIKDYGKFIPGHGGVMDRFDSVIVTAPMTYFLVAVIIQNL